MPVRGARLLLPLGIVALVCGFAYAHATQISAIPYHPLLTSRAPWVAVFALSLILSSYAIGLPDLPRSRFGVVALSIVAIGMAVVFVSLAQLVSGTAVLPRAIMLGVGLTLPPWAVLVWNTQSDVAQRRMDRAVFVGREEDGAALSADLRLHVEPPAEIVRRLTTEDAVDDDALITAVQDVDADVLILGLAAQEDPRVVAQSAQLHKEGLKIRTVSLFTEEYLGKLPVADLERVSLLFDVGEVHRLRYQRAKRIVDIVIAFLALPVLLLTALPVWLVNVATSRGPLFFQQERVGRDGEPFTIYKFRSMRVGGPSTWTVEGDDRITLAGRFLRPSHLDELPQLINILRGDLSLVGPRPEQTAYVEELRTKVPFYDVRHLVRPGLTGWAQVRYPYGSDAQDALEKLQYDLYYLRRQSIGADFAIIVRTVRAVLRGSGR